jgi:hypothetical protein
MFRRNGIESGVRKSKEKQMKSVDRDFGSKEYVKANWLVAYLMLVGGAIFILVKIRGEIPHQGLQIIAPVIVGLLLLYMFPLLSSLQFSRYVRKALKEDLVSERVAKNYDRFIGQQLIVVYLVIMLLIWS